MDVRQIRWEYTFYADGRWITAVTINNAGGEDLPGVRITTPMPAAWSNGWIGKVLTVSDFAGPVGIWSFLIAPPGSEGDSHLANFARPPPAMARLARPNSWAAGDADRDGFDESQ
ncbi:MAG: hypothetical protein HQ546_00825, partial [Planctomycetes bacterium]|nr:hypothetical protein [Planctomycetota bacterium]